MLKTINGKRGYDIMLKTINGKRGPVTVLKTINRKRGHDTMCNNRVRQLPRVKHHSVLF